MPKGNKKLADWQLYRAGFKALGREEMTKIFGTACIRTIYAHAQDPDSTQPRGNSPLKNFHTMLSRLDEVGRTDVVRAAINYLETAIDPDLEFPPVSDCLPTVEKEILADYRAVAEMQQAIENCEPLDVLKEKAQAAVDEIWRTVAKVERGNPYEQA